MVTGGAAPVISSTPHNERWLVQSARILHHNKDAVLCPGDRIVQQASLALDRANDLVGP